MDIIPNIVIALTEAWNVESTSQWETTVPSFWSKTHKQAWLWNPYNILFDTVGNIKRWNTIFTKPQIVVYDRLSRMHVSLGLHETQQLTVDQVGEHDNQTFEMFISAFPNCNVDMMAKDQLKIPFLWTPEFDILNRKLLGLRNPALEREEGEGEGEEEGEYSDEETIFMDIDECECLENLAKYGDNMLDTSILSSPTILVEATQPYTEEEQ